jgi:hypothetical protein
MIDILYTYNIQIHNKAAIFLLRVQKLHMTIEKGNNY